MKVTYIRHAESIFNVDSSSKLHDCGLTTVGIEQASLLQGEYDLALISPLKRARETLEYSQIKYHKLETLHILREYKEDPCDYFEDEQEIPESEEELTERQDSFIKYLYDLRGYRTVIVISHGELLNGIIGKGLRNTESYIQTLG